MKTLYIVRHAKSSWKDAELKDFERPLKRRGVRDAFLIAEKLSELNITPQHVLSSPSVRAYETAKIFCNTLSFSKENIETNSSIYNATLEELQTILLNIDNKLNAVMMFGHDPGLTNFVAYLTKQSYEKIPTSGVVAIQFETDQWNKIEEHSGKIVFFIYPKMFE
jgi:phosphohistidine phosphatase